MSVVKVTQLLVAAWLAAAFVTPAYADAIGSFGAVITSASGVSPVFGFPPDGIVGDSITGSFDIGPFTCPPFGGCSQAVTLTFDIAGQLLSFGGPPETGSVSFGYHRGVASMQIFTPIDYLSQDVASLSLFGDQFGLLGDTLIVGSVYSASRGFLVEGALNAGFDITSFDGQPVVYPVPEPAGWTIVAAGLVGIVALRRWRQAAGSR